MCDIAYYRSLKFAIVTDDAPTSVIGNQALLMYTGALDTPTNRNVGVNYSSFVCFHCARLAKNSNMCMTFPKGHFQRSVLLNVLCSTEIGRPCCFIVMATRGGIPAGSSGSLESIWCSNDLYMPSVVFAAL